MTGKWTSQCQAWETSLRVTDQWYPRGPLNNTDHGHCSWVAHHNYTENSIAGKPTQWLVFIVPEGAMKDNGRKSHQWSHTAVKPDATPWTCLIACAHWCSVVAQRQGEYFWIGFDAFSTGGNSYLVLWGWAKAHGLGSHRPKRELTTVAFLNVVKLPPKSMFIHLN